MATGVYSNGLPHLPIAMRTRLAIELGVVAVATALFLIFAPTAWRNNGTYVGLALVALGLIRINAQETRERIWGPPESPDFDRIRRCFTNMTILTLPPLIVFFIWGLIAGGFERVFQLNFLIAVLLYIPWALLQQTLFQFYLLGRLRALLPFASPLLLSVVNGIAYGLVHLPNGWVTLVTIIGGIFWSYSYHRDRYVLPIAISHALLGSTFYYWVYDQDLVAKLTGAGI